MALGFAYTGVQEPVQAGSFPVAWGVYRPCERERIRRQLEAAIKVVNGFVGSSRPPTTMMTEEAGNRYRQSWILVGPGIIRFEAKTSFPYTGFVEPVMWVEGIW